MMLTTAEKSFLDVFLHEATTPPFTGPATASLHAIGVEYGDISHIVWAYERDVSRAEIVGHSAKVSPPLPWHNRQSALQRDLELQQFWQQRREPAAV